MSASLILVLPAPTEIVYSNLDLSQQAAERANVLALAAAEQLLTQYDVDQGHRARVARAVAVSSRKHKVDPRLVTSIMIVESGANPAAISSRQAVGIMQVHLGTWGEKADQEGVNLFRIEDNVDFGVRILKDYVERYGLWGGVRRYKGWTGAPGSREEANQYVQKVRRIYRPNTPAS